MSRRGGPLCLERHPQGLGVCVKSKGHRGPHSWPDAARLNDLLRRKGR